MQRYHRVYGCSKVHISLVIEILLKEEFIVGLSFWTQVIYKISLNCLLIQQCLKTGPFLVHKVQNDL